MLIKYCKIFSYDAFAKKQSDIFINIKNLFLI